jgi:hypothetical protein
MADPVKKISIKLTLDGGEQVNAVLDATEDNLAALKDAIKQASDGQDGLNTQLLNFNQRLAAVQQSAALLQQTFGAAVGSYDALTQSQNRLTAASKLANIELDELQDIARQSRESFGFSERQANDFTIALAKLTAKAGDTSKTADAIGALLNVAAAQGLNAEQALQAINQAILGIDEGTDKLFQKNPSVIYKEYADAIGTTVGKLTDQQKAQALLAATMQASEIVGDTYTKFLETGAGMQADLTARTEEFHARVGALIREALGPLLQSGISVLELFARSPEGLQTTIISLGSVAAVTTLLARQGIKLTVDFAAMRTMLATLPGTASIATLSLSGLSTALGVAARTVQSFLVSIGPVGWLFLGATLVPTLVDGAKALFGFGKEAEEAKAPVSDLTDSVSALRTEVSRLRPEEIEERLKNVKQAMSVIQGMIRETGSKPFLSPENRQILDANIQAFTRLSAEAAVLEAQLKKVKSSTPGTEDFKPLSVQIKEIKERLAEIADNAVTGIVPPEELKKARDLQTVLADLLQKQKAATAAVNVVVPVTIKPVVAPIEPAELFPADETFDVQLKLNTPAFYESVDGINAALQSLQTQFNAATTDQARAEIQALIQQYELMRSRLQEGISSESVAADFKAIEVTAKGTVDAMRAALPQIETLLASDSITVSQRRFLEGFKKTFEETIEETDRFNSAARALFQGTVVNTISSFADAAGEALATGDTKGMMMAFLMPIADGLSQFGKMLVQAGIAKLAFFKALGGGPISAGAAIAAGVALIAVSAAIKSHLNKMAEKETKKDDAQAVTAQVQRRGFATGGIVAEREVVEIAEQGPEMILSAPATARLAPFFPMLNKGILPSIQVPVPVNMTQPSFREMDINVGGSFELSGRDLVAVVRRVTKLEKATGMGSGGL